MAAAGLKAVYQWVVRTMMKAKGETGIVQTMPKKDIVEMNTQITAQRLMQNGIDPTTLKNADQVENAIIAIENRQKANLAENIRGGIGNTKTAKVFDLEGKEIDPKKGIMGGKQIPDDDLPPPGSRGGPDDIAAPVQSAEETIKNMIEAENKKNIAKMRNRKMVKDAIDNASPGFVSGDRKYNAQLVAEDLAEKKFGKEFSDLDQRQQMDLYDEALEGLSEQTRGMPDPEDFAQGGRAGFDNGGAPSIKLFPRARGREVEQEVGPGIKISQRDIDYGITGLFQGDKFFGGAEIDKGKVKLDVVSPDGNTLFKDTISKPDAVNLILGMGDPRGDKFQIKTDKDFENMQITFNTKFNQGGRAGFKSGSYLFQGLKNLGKKYRGSTLEALLENPKLLGTELGYEGIMEILRMGGMLQDGGRAGFFLGSASKFPKGLATLREIINAVTKNSDVIKNPSNILKMVNPKAFNKMLEDAKGKLMPKEGIMATDKVKDYQTEMAKDRIKTVRDLLESGKNLKALDNTRAELIDMYMKEIMRKGNFNKEQAKGIVTQLVDIQVGKSSGAKLTDEGISQLENILKNMETGGKKKRDLNADGGRIGFKDGMTRRTFLKILGGVMSIPIVGKILKPLKLATGVKKVPIIKTDNVPGKPEWFDQLVNKVIIEGDDVTKRFATGERQSIHQKTLDDGSVVRVTEDVDDGAVRVEYESDESMFGEPVQLQYKKPKPDEGDPSPAAEFEVSESGFVSRPDGPDDYVLEGEAMTGSNIRELESDVSKLKQYATGKGPTMKEIVEIKKRKDKVRRLNEGDYAETSQYVSERQPEPDIEYGGDFASGGIARMLGE